MNIINAILNLVRNPITRLAEYYYSNNRINDIGIALEEYIKDLFADSFNLPEKDRLERICSTFSYLGNQSNPPDAMLRGGDAIEVKKIQTDTASLALNSSYPKRTIRCDNPMITKACKDAEKWEEKDLIYTVGIVKNNNLHHLSMVYGLDYCACEDCYTRIKNTIKKGVESIPNVCFSESKELGHINRVDPLGITYMRIRGMWGIENPWKVFNYVYQKDTSKTFTFMCIINEMKWNSFNNRNKLVQMQLNYPELRINDVKIKNPDNPAQLKKAKLITFSI